MTVRASYSDGSDRDVTSLALFLTSNEASAKIKDGLITTGQRGEAFVMARFGTFTVGSQVIVIPKGLHTNGRRSRSATSSISWSTKNCATCASHRAKYVTTKRFYDARM